jgi:hypothetical protein
VGTLAASELPSHNHAMADITSGSLGVARGGTGAGDASGARTNLGAAASGANSDITSLSALTTALSVGQGGTGQSTLTANSVLLGNGTNAIANSGAMTDGTILVGRSGNTPVAKSLLGTTNQVTVTNNASDVTLSLPQAIATTSDVTFDQVTAGGVMAANAGLTVGDGSGTDLLSFGTMGRLNLPTATFTANGQLRYNAGSVEYRNDSATTVALQNRVGGTCAAGSSISSINADGTVTCETDDTGTAGTTVAVEANDSSVVGALSVLDFGTAFTVAQSPTGEANISLANNAVSGGAGGTIQDLTIANADIASGAAIAYSKLNLTNSIVNADVASGAAIAYSKLNLSNSVTSGDVTFNYAGSSSKGGAATSATALAANGSNCGAGQAAGGVDASGNAEGCFTPSGGGGGTVTSVGLSMPAEFSVTNSPVTGSGTLTVAKANQSVNTVYAGPGSGGAGAPGFRSLVAADIPSHNHAAGNINSGQLAMANGGTGASLSDPGADRMLFWDDSAGTMTWMSLGTGLSISGGTTLNSSGGISGSGTTGVMPIWTGSTSLDDSPIAQDQNGTLEISGTADPQLRILGTGSGHALIHLKRTQATRISGISFFNNNTHEWDIHTQNNGSALKFYSAEGGQNVVSMGGFNIVYNVPITLNSVGGNCTSLRTNGNSDVVCSSSDERLKNVEKDYDRGLNSIMAIQPKYYRWNEKSNMHDDALIAGFIAQNVQKVIPEAVREGKNGYLTFSDTPVTAALVNAVKELKAENDALKKRLEALEEKLGR